MHERRSFRVDELASLIGGRVEGDGSLEVTGFASLADAGPAELSFYTNERYAELLDRTRAGALVTRAPVARLRIPQILLAEPSSCINALMDLFYPPRDNGIPSRDLTARVAESVSLGEGVRIGAFAFIGGHSSIGARTIVHPHVYIGPDVRIGEDCVLWPQVVVGEGTRIGSRVILHPGAVIGADGFGYTRRDDRFVKIRHVGTVLIEDDVEVGANSTIDRATLGRTVLRRGVKLDNLVHIGHNVEIQEDTIMAAQCGVSGSTSIGRRVMMGGQVGLVDHLKIGDDAVLIAQSGVIGDVPPGTKVSGYPARPHREVLRAQAEMRSLKRLRERLRAVEERLERILDRERD